MFTANRPMKSVLPRTQGLVEMNWDPISRIVGSLGVFTKIDFKNREVKECYSSSSIFRGYSVFMKGKDPRDVHFISSVWLCLRRDVFERLYMYKARWGIPTFEEALESVIPDVKEAIL